MIKRYWPFILSLFLVFALFGCSEDLLKQEDDGEEIYYEALAMALSHMSYDAVDITFEGTLWPNDVNWDGLAKVGAALDYTEYPEEDGDPEETVTGTYTVTAPQNNKFNLTITEAEFTITLEDVDLGDEDDDRIATLNGEGSVSDYDINSTWNWDPNESDATYPDTIYISDFSLSGSVDFDFDDSSYKDGTLEINNLTCNSIKITIVPEPLEVSADWGDFSGSVTFDEEDITSTIIPLFKTYLLQIIEDETSEG